MIHLDRHGMRIQIRFQPQMIPELVAVSFQFRIRRTESAVAHFDGIQLLSAVRKTNVTRAVFRQIDICLEDDFSAARGKVTRRLHPCWKFHRLIAQNQLIRVLKLAVNDADRVVKGFVDGIVCLHIAADDLRFVERLVTGFKGQTADAAAQQCRRAAVHIVNPSVRCAGVQISRHTENHLVRCHTGFLRDVSQAAVYLLNRETSLGCDQPIDAVSLRIVQAQHIAVEIVYIVDLKLQINAALGHDIEIADEPRMFIRHYVAENAAAVQFRPWATCAVVDFPAGFNAIRSMNFIHRIRKAKHEPFLPHVRSVRLQSPARLTARKRLSASCSSYLSTFLRRKAGAFASCFRG